ncbi:MAG: hypothetical protein KC877_03760 [Candidatus Kaiserbacteria bacterium]|nr:hypothetical protein [Candidatus Kaiserbacteria bacterium]MCB9816143.1 hypothetical protein [Candidatus Nomurabacteria bacterium]
MANELDLSVETVKIGHQRVIGSVAREVCRAAHAFMCERIRDEYTFLLRFAEGEGKVLIEVLYYADLSAEEGESVGKVVVQSDAVEEVLNKVAVSAHDIFHAKEWQTTYRSTIDGMYGFTLSLPRK